MASRCLVEIDETRDAWTHRLFSGWKVVEAEEAGVEVDTGEKEVTVHRLMNREVHHNHSMEAEHENHHHTLRYNRHLNLALPRALHLEVVAGVPRLDLR